MPIAHRVDHALHLVVAVGHGVVTDADVFGYEHELRACEDARGYDELIDMTPVVRIDVPSPDRVRELAQEAADADLGHPPSRLAIIAPSDITFGLGRMFQAHRQLNPRSRKQVGVFRTEAEALAYLGLARRPEQPPFG